LDLERLWGVCKAVVIKKN